MILWGRQRSPTQKLNQTGNILPNLMCYDSMNVFLFSHIIAFAQGMKATVVPLFMEANGGWSECAQK